MAACCICCLFLATACSRLAALLQIGNVATGNIPVTVTQVPCQPKQNIAVSVDSISGPGAWFRMYAQVSTRWLFREICSLHAASHGAWSVGYVLLSTTAAAPPCLHLQLRSVCQHCLPSLAAALCNGMLSAGRCLCKQACLCAHT